MRSSKESLKILFDNACNDKEGFIPLMNESYLNVEKDLEALEILKSHAKLIELNSVYIGYPKTIVIAIEPNDDGYEKIKELIENEIH